MLIFLATAIALAQSTATLTITARVVDSGIVDSVDYPVVINDTRVVRWDILADGDHVRSRWARVQVKGDVPRQPSLGVRL